MDEKLKGLLFGKKISINTDKNEVRIHCEHHWFDSINENNNKELGEIFLELRKIQSGEI